MCKRSDAIFALPARRRELLVLAGISTIASLLVGALLVVFLRTERSIFSNHTLLLLMLTLMLAGAAFVCWRRANGHVMTDLIHSGLTFGVCATLFYSIASLLMPVYVPIHVSGPVPDRALCLMPLDGFPIEATQTLQRHFEQKYKIPTVIAQSLTLPASAKDGQQLVGEDVVAVMQLRTVLCPTPLRSLVIGLTDQDLRIKSMPDWRYAFAYNDGTRFAVVSNHRMNAIGASQRVLDQRLRKMTTKLVGLLYYRLETSWSPMSVLYYDIGGLRELDAMGEDF